MIGNQLTQFVRIIVNLTIAIPIMWLANQVHFFKPDKSISYESILMCIVLNATAWFYIFQAIDAAKKIYNTFKEDRKQKKVQKEKDLLDMKIASLKLQLGVSELQKTKLTIKVEETLKQDFTESQKEELVCSFLEESNKIDSEIDSFKKSLRDAEIERYQSNLLDEVFSARHTFVIQDAMSNYNRQMEHLDRTREHLMNAHQRLTSVRERLEMSRTSMLHDLAEDGFVEMNIEMCSEDIQDRINAMNGLMDNSRSGEI